MEAPDPLDALKLGPGAWLRRLQRWLASDPPGGKIESAISGNSEFKPDFQTAIGAFAAAIGERLAQRQGDLILSGELWGDDRRQALWDQVSRGDPVDVAVCCLVLWYYADRTIPRPPFAQAPD